MGNLICIDFAKRSRQYTKQPQPEAHEAELAAMFATGLDTDPEVLAAFYESSLGYVMAQAGIAPDTAPCEYCAPEIDPA